MTETETMYGERIGRIVNAYAEQVHARGMHMAHPDNQYDAAAHKAAADALDALLIQLSKDSDRMDYLCDWFSGRNEIVIASTRDGDGKRVDKETSNCGARDRLWVYEGADYPGYSHETVREALDDAMRENGQ